MKLYEPPITVWHHDWEKNGKRISNVGLVLATFTAETDEEYAWTIPPGSFRPLTFKTSALVRLDGENW